MILFFLFGQFLRPEWKKPESSKCSSTFSSKMSTRKKEKKNNSQKKKHMFLFLSLFGICFFLELVFFFCWNYFLKFFLGSYLGKLITGRIFGGSVKVGQALHVLNQGTKRKKIQEKNSKNSKVIRKVNFEIRVSFLGIFF